MKLFFLPLALALLSHGSSTGPFIVYKTNQAQSSLTIEGTSTLHDWKMSARNMTGSIDVNIYKDSIDVKNLKLTIPVKSLASGKAAMDKNAYKALKMEKHPEIRYQLSRVKSFEKTGENKINLITEGKLTVAGNTQALTIPITATIKENGIEFKGQTRFLMSRFGVEPPTFMFGSVNTGDEITILFNINYN